MMPKPKAKHGSYPGGLTASNAYDDTQLVRSPDSTATEPRRQVPVHPTLDSSYGMGGNLKSDAMFFDEPASTFYAALFEATRSLYLVLAADSPRFTIVDVNAAYLRATMTQRESLIGRGVFEAFPDNPTQQKASGISDLRKSLERALAQRGSDAMAMLQYDIRRPDGSFEERYWNPTNTAMLNAAGEPVGILHHAEDVTEYVLLRTRGTELDLKSHLLEAEVVSSVQRLKDANERLRASEERYRALASASSDVIYQMSADWTEMRPLQAREFIADTHEPSGSWLHKYIAPEDRLRVTDSIQAAICSKGVFELEHQVVRVDGTTGWTFSRAIPLLDGNGEIREWLGAASDVTLRKQAEEALRQSEAKFRTLYESIDEGFATVEVLFDGDRAIDYIILETNEAHESVSGMPRTFVGKRARQVMPDIEESIIERVGRVALTGEPVRFEQYVGALGRWFDIHFSRIGGEGSRTVASLAKNITERKRREHHAVFLDNLSQALTLLESPEEIVRVAGEALGVHLDVSFVHLVEVKLDPEEEPADACFTVRATWEREGLMVASGTYRAGDYLSEEFLRAARAGETIIIRDTDIDSRVDPAAYRAIGIRGVVVVPILKDDAWPGLIAVATPEMRDWRPDEVNLIVEVAHRVFPLIERVCADAALRASRAELTEADRRKDEFIAMLAHELRNPLAPIRMGLDLIRLAGDKPGSVEPVRAMMERQIGHMVRLIDDLLDVSRITSGKLRLQPEPTPLDMLVNGAIEANRAAIAAKQIELKIDLPTTLCLLDVDPTRFIQVISNLLHNATKFTEPGGSICVAAHVGSSDGTKLKELSLSVIDSGIGISAELLPHIFKLFTQGERGSSLPGLGIGLALARRLVEMHGGKIDALSNGSGTGSELLIRLPLSSTAEQPRSAEQIPVRTLGRRVVVIDDNHDAADTTAMVIEALGGECRVAYDGISGVREVLAHRPEIVLLDIGMPGLDGYETCSRIRRELGSGVFVVALTGFGREQDRDKALQFGFDAHLTKPADPKELARFLSDLPGDPDESAQNRASSDLQ